MKLLLVSSTEKSIRDFREVLSSGRAMEILSASGVSAAIEILKKGDIDIVLINSPLKDGDGLNLGFDIADGGQAQVIMILPPSAYNDRFGEHGIFVIERPISANMFWTVIRLATATQSKVKSLARDNEKLKTNLEIVKIVDRAKCCLIQYLDMSEESAHRYIEKQAMNKRITRREVAEEILKTYEN